jgi:hypothetical protein
VVWPFVIAAVWLVGAVQPVIVLKATVCGPTLRFGTTAPLACHAPPSTLHIAPALTAAAGPIVTVREPAALFVKILILPDPLLVSVETMTVLLALITGVLPPLSHSPETQAITPVDEIDKAPVPLLVDPSLPVDDDVNVPSELIVTAPLSQ